jgi:hypothetical protein
MQPVHSFLRRLLPFAFAFYLIPGGLLHELVDHQEVHCEIHLSHPAEDSIDQSHRHCELLQLDLPSLFQNHDQLVTLIATITTSTVLDLPEQLCKVLFNTIAARGPPVADII